MAKVPNRSTGCRATLPESAPEVSLVARSLPPADWPAKHRLGSGHASSGWLRLCGVLLWVAAGCGTGAGDRGGVWERDVTGPDGSPPTPAEVGFEDVEATADLQEDVPSHEEEVDERDVAQRFPWPCFLLQTQGLAGRPPTMRPATFLFALNDLMLWISHHQGFEDWAYSVERRDVVRMPVDHAVVALSGNQRVRLRVQSGVSDRAELSRGGEHLLTIPSPVPASWTGGILDHEGTRYALGACVEGTRVHVLVGDVAAQEPVWRGELPEDLPCTFYEAPPKLAFVRGRSGATDEGLVVATQRSGLLYYIDLPSGEVVRREAHLAPSEDGRSGAVFAVAASPDQRTVLTTGADGYLHAWRVPELRRRGASLAAGRTRVNEMRFAPVFDASPIAWMRDSSAFVMAGPDAELLYVSAYDHQVMSRAALPAFEVSPDEFWESDDGLIALATDHGQRQVAAIYQRGMALFSCGAARPGGDGRALDLRVEAPEALRVGEAFDVVVHHESDQPLVAVNVGWDGHPYRGGLGGTFRLGTPPDAGERVLYVVVEDGFQRALWQQSVRVLP